MSTVKFLSWLLKHLESIATRVNKTSSPTVSVRKCIDSRHFAFDKRYLQLSTNQKLDNIFFFKFFVY
jgi:hypothetical protein